MGQRHQVFVIARIGGRYRCVGAFHSQWLWGTAAVSACARLLRALANPLNAAAVASELALASEYPYLTGLVLSTFRLDCQLLRMHGLSVLSNATVPSRCMNDDGYTCVDVSEPGKPRYCFWFSRRGRMPMDQYLRYYEDEDLPSEDDYTRVGMTKLVTLEALAETWPTDFQLQDAGESGAADPRTDDQTSDSAPAKGSENTLAELSFRATVQKLLQPDSTDSDDTDTVAQIMQTRYVTPLREELLAIAQAGPLSANGITLLALLISTGRDKLVDLSPWLRHDALRADQLDLLVDALQHAETIDISASTSLTADVVQALVPKLPNLRHLFAFGCTNLGPLTERLPLTTYLATALLKEAVVHKRMPENGVLNIACVRVAAPKDAPAALTVFAFAQPLASYGALSTQAQMLMMFAATAPRSSVAAPERFGVELAHCGAEGVVRGFNTLLRLIYEGRDGMCDSASFFLRAAFHATGTLPIRLPDDDDAEEQPSESFGCLPSLANDGEGGGDLTAAPRRPGWSLVFDTRGPPARNALTGLLSMLDITGATTSDSSVYAFVRWAYASGTTGRLVAAESLSVRDWAARHGLDGGPALDECDRLLSVAKAVLLSVEQAERVRVSRKATSRRDMMAMMTADLLDRPPPRSG
ncbi:hypothetical protein AURDEDRAFT_117321 [Auricularia subglabra TFB-10046 SS5]|nr:hypothetical protein AURDEDRAFT_117321 [Auricularia subglabra TFB-10046 SS5]